MIWLKIEVFLTIVFEKKNAINLKTITSFFQSGKGKVYLKEVIRMAKEVPDFEIKKADDYKEAHLDGVFGGLNPNGAKLMVYTEEHMPKINPRGKPGNMTLDKIERELQVELHMSPVQFKSLFNWMKRHLENYEDKFGEIEVEVESEESPEKMYG